MSRAKAIIQGLDEIGYYGQHDDYGTKEYTQDAGEYMEPFKDVELPDNSVKNTKKVKNSSEKTGKKTV